MSQRKRPDATFLQLCASSTVSWTSNDGIQHHRIVFDPKVVHEYHELQERQREPPSSSVAAPMVFANSELAETIMLYLSHQDLLRFHQVNKQLHLIAKSKLFFVPGKIEAPIDFNPFISKAFPRWFGSGHRQRRPGETRILTDYDTEEGQRAIKESREGEGASWRRMMICSQPLSSIQVLHNDYPILIRENMQPVRMGDIHECIESVRRCKHCPGFQQIKFAYNGQIFKVKLV